jgi:methanogenic corrinoid protein MtbC1
MNEELKKAMSDLQEETMLKLLKERLEAGDDPLALLEACREGMAQVGKRYESGEYYVSDLMMAGEIFKQAMALFGSSFQSGGGPKRGIVVFGTVQGDIHDIGKDIVVGFLQAANYNVIDLGVDVPPAKFVAAVKENSAPVLGLSGLLTISYDAMQETIEGLKAAGLRDKVKVMVGGGMVTDKVCASVGADAMGRDAQAAVNLCDQWI